MPTDLAELDNHFSIPGVVRFDAGKGGLTRALITSPLAEAEVYLHGAHVTAYRPAKGEPVLWVSGKSWFEANKPIRGGVPICFPWFGARAGDATSPAHGFARLKDWAVETVHQTADGVVEIILSLAADEQTHKTWPHDFSARYHVRVGKVLELVLRVRNEGREAFDFEEALHAYFTVGDVRKASVTGLEGTTYIDKMDGMKHKPQGADAVVIAAETDRVHTQTRATCVLHDPVLGRTIQVAKGGSDSTVVWNPWIAKSKAMADFGADEWPGMICIETCNVGDQRVTVAPGETAEMRAAIGVG